MKTRHMKTRPTKTRPMKTSSPEFLSGWKEIASYLGKGVRTVQRYERQLGLPVRRPAGKASGSVIGLRAEIDGWVQASSIRETFRLTTPLRYPPLSESFRKGVSEMARLRDEMFKLRSEIGNSLLRLRDSIQVLLQDSSSVSREEVDQRGSKDPFDLYSRHERDLLDRSASDLATAPVKYSKAS